MHSVSDYEGKPVFVEHRQLDTQETDEHRGIELTGNLGEGSIGVTSKKRSSTFNTSRVCDTNNHLI